MKEEDIDNRIERVIKSVASKKAAMTKWESERKLSEMRRSVNSKRWRTFGIPAAASIVVICAIGIGVYMNRPGNADYDEITSTSAIPTFRGGSSDIDEIKRMIVSRKYEEALHSIDKKMADTIIDPTYSEERQEYLRSVNKNQIYELTWLKIQVLVKLKKEKEAVTLLENHVKNEGAHQTEAKELLEKIKK